MRYKERIGLLAIPYLCGMSNAVKASRVLCMIRGFLDESAQGDVFVLAGWVTDHNTWKSFSEDWQTALDESPAIQYFSHHEAKGEPPSGEFKDWPIEQVQAKMDRLADVICRHEMYGVVSGLNLEVFRAAFSESIVPWKVLRTVMKHIHEYHSVVFSTHALILQIQLDRGNRTDKVDLILDEQVGLTGECIDLYKQFKERPEFPPEKKAIAGLMTEANDKDVAALQAADFLAGQVTTAYRLGAPESYYQRIGEAHHIYQSQAYFPSFDKIPDLIRLFNMWWSIRRIDKASGVIFLPRSGVQ